MGRRKKRPSNFDRRQQAANQQTNSPVSKTTAMENSGHHDQGERSGHKYNSGAQHLAKQDNASPGAACKLKKEGRQNNLCTSVAPKANQDTLDNCNGIVSSPRYKEKSDCRILKSDYTDSDEQKKEAQDYYSDGDLGKNKRMEFLSLQTPDAQQLKSHSMDSGYSSTGSSSHTLNDSELLSQKNNFKSIDKDFNKKECDKNFIDEVEIRHLKSGFKHSLEKYDTSLEHEEVNTDEKVSEDLMLSGAVGGFNDSNIDQSNCNSPQETVDLGESLNIDLPVSPNDGICLANAEQSGEISSSGSTSLADPSDQNDSDARTTFVNRTPENIPADNVQGEDHNSNSTDDVQKTLSSPTDNGHENLTYHPRTQELIPRTDPIPNEVNDDFSPTSQRNSQLVINTSSYPGCLTTYKERPLYKQYLTKRTRFVTFIGVIWPWPFPDATELVLAGFFYKGPGDRVQCFYCGIVLYVWEPTDLPICEHRKHSPGCEYAQDLDVSEDVTLSSVFDRAITLVTRFGYETTIIDNALELLDREGKPLPKAKEIINKLAEIPDEYPPLDEDSLDEYGATGYTPTLDCDTTQPNLPHNIKEDDDSPDGINIDLQYDSPDNSIVAPRIPNINEATTGNGANIESGPGLDEVDGTFYSAPNSFASSYNSFEQDLGAYADIAPTRENTEVDDSEDSDPDSGDCGNADKRQELIKKLRAKNEELKSWLRCRVCLENDANQLYIDCGHLSVCQGCSTLLRDCPICRKHIRGAITVYLTSSS